MLRGEKKNGGELTVPQEACRKSLYVKEELLKRSNEFLYSSCPELLVLYNWGICRAQVLSYRLVQAMYDAAGFGLSRLS